MSVSPTVWPVYYCCPYWTYMLENDKVYEIKIFSHSILKWVTESDIEENMLIRKYSLTFKKIKNFAMGLNNICDFAIKNGYGFVGIGD